MLPGLGPVTVQPRKTLVTLFTPRRAFAAVRATTRDRVDLGLRLDDAGPGGRLLAAGNVGGGGVTVRVALARPDDVDDEVRDLMRRAYAENSAPPPPPRPARRSGAQRRDDGRGDRGLRATWPHLPAGTGRTRPRERPRRAVQPRHGPARADHAGQALDGHRAGARRRGRGPLGDAQVTVKAGPDGGFDFAGPFVRGVRDDRHLGLVWGDLVGDGTLRLFRGAKLRLVDVDPELIEQALRPGHKLVARIRLTDAKGNPICARVHPPYLTWSVTAPGYGAAPTAR